jgi:D-alanine--poly(phosphoribitol) ligase subunit 2
MSLDKVAISIAIKNKIIEIAARMGDDASELQNDDIIPATGLIDSAGLLELIAWYEDHFQFRLAQEEITIDNLGTLTSMADFVLKRKAVA